mmetsp:Transcript_126746/g.405846  ORF Transcript_126746/g.405846 Transcript_126746/m.405846 type:complete len:773 (+) Transcript_126746:92-2410(+)|eukprot:CAMPEP_0203892650 /NCGR_PEP_ID=MMETSP0359-20131031/35818_1 /ASSEMBLY_ACC=CAM_ASM_000338 /TAXON_ID=268821 /ORGANISM="Scrippsiella Hangoei, Strain SHTV-5" /LENGTH=772 /DNA_ID=CAMNT_0050814657 /DNA_START=71 /DNA_END=2389 /DNA_ORIENTATION=-
MRSIAAALVLSWAASAPRAASTEVREVMVDLHGGGKIGLSTRGPSAFRVRFELDDGVGRPAGLAHGPIETPMVGPDEADAPFQDWNSDGTGIVSGFGSIKVTQDGKLQLNDPMGQPITLSNPVTPKMKNLAFSSKQGQLYGRGASPEDAYSLTKNSAQPLVCNKATYVPYYYSTDGYAALGVTDTTWAQQLPIKYSSNGTEVVWNWDGANSFELYLMPAKSLELGTEAYYSLIGAPLVPPKYTFGFMASRWGWEDRQYMEDIMNKFRADKYPIDAIILDFEWFTNESDYSFQPPGKPNYQDFGFNWKTFSQPKEQLAAYKRNNFRVGGIRKPRLGDTELLALAKNNGWILGNGEPAGGYPPDKAGAYAKERNLDFANPAVRNWYSQNLAHFVEDGMDFWWNDEGETNVWTFHWWNVAQVQALRSKDKLKRFYSLNRAFTPGMARLGATAWTGDVDPTWEELDRTPGMMLNWVLAGAPHVGCDIGGFTGDTQANLLTRWMQVGVFMPTMRVHSTFTATPHFPWLWGEAAATAMRHALELRYRLVPYHYSLAHALFSKKKMWIKPLVVEFPLDTDATHLSRQWMDGLILVAPVTKKNSRKSVYLPEGLWYPLAASPITRGNGRPIQGPTNIDEKASLDEVPAYVRAGTVLPLAPVVQSTEELPGGPLEVQIYSGADGSFDFVEDDGETILYKAGFRRTIKFVWHEADQRLAWSLSGYVLAPGANAFTKLFVTLFSTDGSSQTSDTWPIGVVGSIDLHIAQVTQEGSAVPNQVFQ